VADLSLALDGLGCLVQHRRKPDHALALRAELEEALLDLRAEVDPRRDLVRDRVGVEIEIVELGLRGSNNARVGG
jgi:hypothetical protein